MVKRGVGVGEGMYKKFNKADVICIPLSSQDRIRRKIPLGYQGCKGIYICRAGVRVSIP